MARVGRSYPGGFQLLRELAQGARARVFLASDGTNVEAVKVHAAGDDARADREFRVGRDLDHPNLVTVTKRFDLDGCAAVAMRFVPGRRLDVWSSGAPLELQLHALDGLLAGLGALHERGVVHRDVKPENVLVTRSGMPVLIDYDLASSCGDGRDLRATAGTVAYLSPEIAHGHPAGPGSDLYAVGILLYRALTGQVPFSGSVGEVLELHRSDEPTPPSAFSQELTPYDELLAHLLAKQPQNRYQSAAAVRSAICAASHAASRGTVGRDPG